MGLLQQRQQTKSWLETWFARITVVHQTKHGKFDQQTTNSAKLAEIHVLDISV